MCVNTPVIWEGTRPHTGCVRGWRYPPLSSLHAGYNPGMAGPGGEGQTETEGLVMAITLKL